MSVVANAHWSHKWVMPMIEKQEQSRVDEEFRFMLHVLFFFNPICCEIPCVTTGWAGLEG